MSVIDSQWAEVSEEMPGVPKGFLLIHASRPAEEGEWFIDALGLPVQATFRTLRNVPILERIPKRKILMAEAEVPPDFRIEDGGAIVAYRSGTGVSLDIHRFNAEVFRIEERDA